MAESTKDYKKFKALKGNREKSKGHLTRLTKSIAAYPELLPTRPILVNEKMEVIDGQHRLAACEILGLPVYYEVSEHLGTEAAAIINRNQRNWSTFDYIQSYAAEGKPDYVKWLELKEEYPEVSDTTMIDYASATRGGGNEGNRVRNGALKLRSDMADIKQQLDWLLDLRSVSKDFKRTTVARALKTILSNENYDHDRMLSKFVQYGDSFNPFGTQPVLLREIERIYNFNSKTIPVHLY